MQLIDIKDCKLYKIFSVDFVGNILKNVRKRDNLKLI